MFFLYQSGEARDAKGHQKETESGPEAEARAVLRSGGGAQIESKADDQA